MSRSSDPSLGLRRPGTRKPVSDEEARRLEERLNAAEDAPADVSVDPARAAVADAPEIPRELIARGAYPRGKGSKADPYRRAKDGTSLRATTVYLPESVHGRLRMYCAQDGVRRMAQVSRRTHYARRRAAALDATLEAADTARNAEPRIGLELDATAGALDDVIGRLVTSATLAAAGHEETAPPETPEEAVIGELERARIRRALASLPERELVVVRAIYFEDRALDDVGAQLGISRSWASRIHTRGLELLRQALR